MPLLPFISDEDLIQHARNLVDAAKRSEHKVNENPFKNVIDPFSALVDSARQSISLSEWMEQEKARQMQKSFQNAVGKFHQEVIGSIPGWENAGAGGSYDVINENMKVLAEIKNKHNTMNSTAQAGTYDKLAHWLDYGKSDFQAYVVEIVPSTPNTYSVPFTPSDRGIKRQTRENLRKIDGRSFYALATGYEEAIDLLYLRMPEILAKILNISEQRLKNTGEFKALFEKAYGSME